MHNPGTTTTPCPAARRRLIEPGRALLAAVALSWGVAVAPAAPSSEDIELSPVVARLLEDPVTTDAQRRELALFHGQWDRLEDPTPTERARMALGRYDLTHAGLSATTTPVRVRAEALIALGNAAGASDLLKNEESADALLLRAEALESLGRVREAVKLLAPLRERLRDEAITDAQQLTTLVKATVMLAALEGRPAQDYQLAMSLLGRVRNELDPLYWPAHLAEAQLLIEKDNAPQAAEALFEALRLNPACSIAWYELGRLAVGGFDFVRADRCRKQLHKIHRDHLLADLLEAESLLIQKDPHAARKVIASSLQRHPQHPQLLALAAAAEALAFDQRALAQALERFDARSPGSAVAHYTVGRFLSMARQYPASEEMLRKSIERAGNWTRPRIELGMMLMQQGDETAAAAELAQAVQLDPFNRGAANQLKLARELAGYEQIRTDHFLIKFHPGIDRVLANDMPETLERIYRHLTNVFGHRPPSPTTIEILPDEKRFAVRITGMPDIWTIAACTGDVIALTPPRSGAGLGGTYDWVRVLQHEFVHTITLNQTNYRIPHWFTEGCAVFQEPGGRPYQECLLLAEAYAEDRLFDLDEINWAFVRPKEPRDRPLAYAQSSWIVQYITETHGFEAVIKMLEAYRDGASNGRALRTATGRNDEEFMAAFEDWAGQQIRGWGLADDPAVGQKALRRLATGVDGPDELDRLLRLHPDHPGLLKLAATRAVENGSAEEARRAVLRYAAVRPVDPWPDQQMVKLAILTHRTDEAIAALEQLDRHETRSGQWAVELARIHRSHGRLARANAAIGRALEREPFNSDYRELAATVELQLGQPQAALAQLKAMAVLEPKEPIHHVRLAALYHKLDRPEEAASSALAARRLDPDAPVQPYLPQ